MGWVSAGYFFGKPVAKSPVTLAVYYLPWESVLPTPEPDKLVDIQVSYDRTRLAVDDEVGVNVRVRLTKEGKARLRSERRISTKRLMRRGSRGMN